MHVGDVMRPSEMQMGVPVPARAHACTVGCGVMWAWYMARKRVVRVCGCGGGVTVLGRGLCGAARPRGAWATNDALAALCVPEGQAGQPESQEESQLESE